MTKRIRKKTKSELESSEFRDRAQHQAAVLTASYRVAEKLPKKRHQFILDIAANEWMHRLEDLDDYKAYERENREWTKRRKEFLADASKPQELHWFTCNWNAGRGAKPLLDIVRNDYCDAGTCLRLYWVSDPYYYQEYATIGECECEEERGILRVLRTIERRFKREDFKTAKIPFDPTPWIEDKYLESAVHRMPDEMRESI